MPEGAPGDAAAADRGPLAWTRRISLTARILAVNVFALGLMAGSLLYLDSYRRQLLAERFSRASAETRIAAAALGEADWPERRRMLASIGVSQALRLRVFGADGKLLADSFALAPPSYALVDPSRQPWVLKVARVLDRATDLLLGTPPVARYVDPPGAGGATFPEVAQARASGTAVVRQRRAPDSTPVISAAAAIDRDDVLLTTRNAVDVTDAVRGARQTLANVIAGALAVSVLLSLFLARTIVRPLRRLMRAAIRVRLGRDRAVVVPRLPGRADEIGLLARAVSDMSAALRQRIDAVEQFAADVAHELKNPLASLRSAIESLDRVDDPQLRRQLTAIAAHDVRRIDRLVSEIADASRIDGELSRTVFEPVDMGRLSRALIGERQTRGANGACVVTISDPGEAAGDSATGPVEQPLLVAGDAPRLERVLHNLLDNAVSFSQPRAAIEVALSHAEDRVLIAIEDHGPGIAADARRKVFDRFHSLRPPDEAFASHSGLGLAIARTIVEAHNGTLTAHDRADGARGARLVIDLPAWVAPE